MKLSFLSTLGLFISGNLEELKEFLKSISFLRAILIGIAVTLPVIIGLQLGYIEIGLLLALGAFWSSPSDVVGSFRHKKLGILVSAILVMIVSFIKGYLQFELWLLLPILGSITFIIAYISVFGFRASLVSFSGLLTLALSFARDSENLEIYQYAMWLGIGGLWYLLLSIIWYRLNPKVETEEFLIETYTLTSKFIGLRGKLVDPQEDHHKIQSKLIKLQSKLTKNHGTLREILVFSRKTSGLSNYQNKRLLIFVQLVEMLETAVANPGNYDHMDALFNRHPKYIKLFQDLIFEMSYQLRMISIAGSNKKNLPKNHTIRKSLEDIRIEVDLLRDSLDYNEFLMLQNLLEYQEKQFEKLKRIKWLLGDPEASEIEFIDRKSAKRFIELQDYNPKLLVRNLSFKSPIFRHSIRLAVTVMIGFALGSIFSFQNPYSILLIIIVIMRPSYGLTKSRAKDRIIGTLIGGSVAFAVVFLIQDYYVNAVLGIISLVIALSLVQKNYRASSTFITLSVVFIYAILSPDVLSLIKFRILDTFVGAGLSYVAMLWLWPSWEYVEIKENLEHSVKANTNFLHKIADYYQLKGNIPTSFKIARNQAFLETSNLSSAFQRMAQEPKSKQRETDKIYELVVLNHTFLVSLASLSSYVQNYKTSEASERFKTVIEKIEANLEKVLECLKDKDCYHEKRTSSNDLIDEEEIPAFDPAEIRNLASNEKESVRYLQEAQLVWEQLKWLLSMSRKMHKLVASVKLD
ncbi:FUSC family membrane protein [uncultured Cyclobacterium sp.]|uniref:FUSC family protein n=1 Tax=uncultured Cyclobacterium sp. TaxID=453820 RepID=UPI0030EF7BAB|tara:strand:- start:10155 stop:12395 length:2241 start_codon:yes stop_codon:yes gene_type:complete